MTFKRNVWIISIAMLMFGMLAGNSFIHSEVMAKEAEKVVKESTKPTKAGELEDVLIKGEDKMEVKIKKPVLELEEYVLEVDLPSLEMEEQLFSKSPATFEIWREDYGHLLSSQQVAFPGLINLIEEPVATFWPQTRGKKDIIKKWDLVITDSKGRDFKKFKGSGEHTKAIIWNGRNDKNEVLNVGNIYTYVFNYMDIAGNPHTVVGSPFSINALVHQEKKGLVISLANKALFVEERERVMIKEEAANLLQETADKLRDSFGLEFSANGYSDSPSKALQQAQAVANDLAKRLVIWPDMIKVAGYPSEADSQRVEVIIQNR